MSRVCVRPSVMLVMMRVSVCSVEQSGRWWWWWWWWGRITLGIGFAALVVVGFAVVVVVVVVIVVAVVVVVALGARNSLGGGHTQSFSENLHDGIHHATT